MNFADVLSFFQKTRVGIVQDDADDHFRAVLVAPADQCSPEEMNRLLRLSGSHVSVVLSEGRASGFGLSQMHARRASVFPLASSFPLHNKARACVSVEAREGVSSGISAADRARTVSLLGGDIISPRLLVHPGHIFPLVAQAGGVLVDSSLAHCSFDIVQLAGFSDAAIVLELFNDEGEYLNKDEQEKLSQSEGLPILSLAQCVHHRLNTETLVEEIAEAQLPSRFGGSLQTRMFRSSLFSGEHIALVKGPIQPEKPVVVRVQRESLLSDVFGGEPHARQSLQAALKVIGESEQGVLVYLRQSSPSVMSQERGISRMAESRQYGIGAQILRALGVKSIRLLVATPHRYSGLENFGLHIDEQILLDHSFVSNSSFSNVVPS